MKTVIKLLLLALLIRYAPKFCHEQTDGFAITKIHTEFPSLEKWKISSPPKENLEPIFNKRFSYLDSGGQCYVFASDDQKYVLKFFKMHRRRLHPFLKHLPLWGKYALARERQRLRRISKLHRDFDSYKLAFEELSDQTGLVFVQLRPNKHLNLTANIIDKLGIEHHVNLGEVGFILQRKATLTYPHLIALLQNGEKEKVKEAMENIAQLFVSRCEKGIYDGDNFIHRNVGFIDNKAILIDIGRLKKDPRRKDRAVQKIDLDKSLQRFSDWIEKNAPEYRDEIPF